VAVVLRNSFSRHIGDPVFGEGNFPSFIDAYETLPSPTGTDPAATDVIKTYPDYRS